MLHPKGIKAHARRKFFNAEKLEAILANQALNLIGELYAIEAECKECGITDTERILAIREERSRPVVDAFFAFLLTALDKNEFLPSNPFLKVANYALRRRVQMEMILSNYNVPFDTNHLERTLRAMPMDRKAWLFCTTVIGAKHLGIIQSIIVTCLLHDIRPIDYLIDLLQ